MFQASDLEDVSGRVTLDGDDILDLEPDERANKGVFLAFQYPVDIPGVNNAEFLKWLIMPNKV